MSLAIQQASRPSIPKLKHGWSSSNQLISQPGESNALITTKSGQEISLHLVSAGKGAPNARVDFLVEYRLAQSVLISPDKQSFLIAETRPVSSAIPADRPAQSDKPDSVAKQLEKQKNLPSPAWQGKELLAALGDSLETNHQTVLGFSVLNDSKRVIELLPPQLELTGSSARKWRQANQRRSGRRLRLSA